MLQSRIQGLVGQWFKTETVIPGGFYRRIEATIKETAEVLAVEPDGVGIPHVHYIGHCEAKHGHGAEYKVRRMLSVSAFRETFSELN